MTPVEIAIYFVCIELRFHCYSNYLHEFKRVLESAVRVSLLTENVSIFTLK